MDRLGCAAWKPNTCAGGFPARAEGSAAWLEKPAGQHTTSTPLVYGIIVGVPWRTHLEWRSRPGPPPSPPATAGEPAVARSCICRGCGAQRAWRVCLMRRRKRRPCLPSLRLVDVGGRGLAGRARRPNRPSRRHHPSRQSGPPPAHCSPGRATPPAVAVPPFVPLPAAAGRRACGSVCQANVQGSVRAMDLDKWIAKLKGGEFLAEEEAA